MTGVNVAALAALQRETPPDEVKHRPMIGKNGPRVTNGKTDMLSYVDARYVQDLFDEVLSPENWQTRYEDVAGDPTAIRCGIGILVNRGIDTNGVITDGNAEWVWKWDVGTASNIEPAKGAHSDAFKRAAVQWGAARDLYDNRIEAMPALPADDDAPQGARPSTVRERSGNAPRPTTPRNTTVLASFDESDPAWLCPDHQEVKLVPGGTSKKTGNPYDAFLACPVYGCNETGPKVAA